MIVNIQQMQDKAVQYIATYAEDLVKNPHHTVKWDTELLLRAVEAKAVASMVVEAVVDKSLDETVAILRNAIRKAEDHLLGSQYFGTDEGPWSANGGNPISHLLNIETANAYRALRAAALRDLEAIEEPNAD